MPKMAKPLSPPRPITRRSSRLIKLHDSRETASLGAQGLPKPKRRRTADNEVFQVCADENSASGAKIHASSSRRSQRITAAELIRRERALLYNEQECKRRAGELDERILTLSKKEDEASLMISQIAEREAKAMLGQLEEHFTCALCYEIMAHPYTLNPGQCGHTFCAICILKWFFSRLHRACGGWHESVDCPICRSLLVITPDRVPRLDITFPFVPNRTAAAVCESLIEKLAHSPSSSAIIKREESEGMWESGSRPDWQCSRKKDKSKEEEETSENPDVADWREGGSMRAEWLKRDREGKREMNHLSKFWSTLKSQEFIALKLKLGV